jgi:hypothetical protein
MISGQNRVSYNDFGDCHDEITVAGIDFIGTRPICGLYPQGEGCFYEDNTQGIDLIVNSRREEIR